MFGVGFDFFREFSMSKVENDSGSPGKIHHCVRGSVSTFILNLVCKM